ncbi:50S ribosomal protein L17 [Buchnera aphidicola (Taiwanaphis decaspermi)]|uniref:50S ribosomal protein L17 n=1 Tax=Buchnera aphidicola TaxID=9 RepID=UPI0031B8AD51
MNHKKIGRKLNRKSSHLKSMLKNMICSLIKNESIKTTVAKAKELKRVCEPIITKSKINNISNKRIIFSMLRNNMIVYKLFDNIGPRFTSRMGGYIKIVKCGFRKGDNAPMAYLKLMDIK